MGAREAAVIGHMWALLATSAAGPDPFPTSRQRDASETYLLPRQYRDLRADYLDDLAHLAWQEKNDLGGVEHTHTGRLCNQYAKQPRASSSRICRGRP